MRKIWILLPLLLTACNLPGISPDLVSALVTDTPDSGHTECAWVWDTQSLPDLSTEIQSALATAGLTGITVSAEAYGEDCITASGAVDHFATMETDFRITMQVASIDDHEALGTLLEQILTGLDAFPPGVAPGPNPGYIGITFQAGGDEERLWFTVADGASARALGVHGTALLEKLRNP